MKFGKFELLEHIGSGGMAEIFLARPVDAKMSKLIAVKRILPNHSHSEDFHELFLREGEIALRLRHPSIVMAHEIGEVDGDLYMSMEFFPGKSLAHVAKLLREGQSSLPLPEKVYIIKRIAEALQYIHDFSDYGDDTKIIHRDISPQNILVGFDGAAKLIDFGVAKISKGESGTGASDTIQGKFAYMSPEQLVGEGLTSHTDIFSLGVVFFELLTNRRLFAGTSIEQISDKVLNCDSPGIIRFEPGLPESLVKICRRCLAKRPEDRYQQAGDLAFELETYLRRYSDGAQQKRLAASMAEFFPEDVQILREQLKRYEQNELEAAVSLSGSFAPVKRRGPGGSRETPIPKPKAKKKNRISFSFDYKKWIRRASFAGLATGALLAAVSHKDSIFELFKVLSSKIELPRGEVVGSKVEPPTELEASPNAASSPGAVDPGAIVFRQTLPLDSAPAPKRAPSAPRVPKRREPAETEERPKPAKPRPVESFATAILTVIADEGAQIIIDDRVVGAHKVRLKVPANQTLMVRIQKGDGQTMSFQTVNLKPNAQTTLDMSLGGSEAN